VLNERPILPVAHYKSTIWHRLLCCFPGAERQTTEQAYHNGGRVVAQNRLTNVHDLIGKHRSLEPEVEVK